MDKATPTPSPAKTDICELLRSVPKDVILKIDTPNPLGVDTHSIPVGAMCHEAAAEVERLAAQAAPTEEMSPEFTDTARAALLWVLWHHQGASSKVGQPIRFALGMCRHQPLSEYQVREAQRWEAMAPTRDAANVPPGEWNSEPEGLTPKQAWWAGYRVGKGLPPDMPRSEAVAAQAAQAPVVQAGEYPPLPQAVMFTAAQMRAYVDADRASSGAAQAVRVLTREELNDVALSEKVGWGPGEYVEAVQRKFAEVNGLRIPADGKIGGAA